MKKIYMPSMDTLYQMQEMKANVYGYLYVKAIESIILDGINYPNKGMLKNAFNYLKEDYTIATSIGRLYPEEVKYSVVAQNDVKLCLDLLDSKGKISSSPLDNISSFTDGVYENTNVFIKIISLLEEELRNNPRYRFEYPGSRILDKIFNGEIEKDNLPILYRNEVIKALTSIEPAYAFMKEDNIIRKSDFLDNGISRYLSRYHILPGFGNDYRGKDILTEPESNVKRLLRCINTRNK